MRLQGGTRGILTALDSGRLDPLDGYIPDPPLVSKLTGSERRQIERRKRAKAKRLAARLGF